jgi:formylmethanofuran dehydrogenase subunit E
MQQEAGHCDRCGAVLAGPAQLTVDDGELCESCVTDDARWRAQALKREAATDGR